MTNKNRCKHGDAAERNKRGQCLECKRLRFAEYRTAHPERFKDYRRTYQEQHPEASKESLRKYFGTERGLLSAARARAKREGYAFTIAVADIAVPEFCPLLGVKLERSDKQVSPASPSLDRIIPELGYVPGNVWVISHRANSIKNNATLSELQMLTANLTIRMQTP